MIRRPPTEISLKQSDVQELLQSRERGDGPVPESLADRMPEDGQRDDNKDQNEDQDQEPTPNQSTSRDFGAAAPNMSASASHNSNSNSNINDSFAEDSIMVGRQQHTPLTMHERILGRGRGR